MRSGLPSSSAPVPRRTSGRAVHCPVCRIALDLHPVHCRPLICKPIGAGGVAVDDDGIGRRRRRCRAVLDGTTEQAVERRADKVVVVEIAAAADEDPSGAATAECFSKSRHDSVVCLLAHAVFLEPDPGWDTSSVAGRTGIAMAPTAGTPGDNSGSSLPVPDAISTWRPTWPTDLADRLVAERRRRAFERSVSNRRPRDLSHTSAASQRRTQPPEGRLIRTVPPPGSLDHACANGQHKFDFGFAGRVECQGVTAFRRYVQQQLHGGYPVIIKARTAMWRGREGDRHEPE